MSQKRQRRVNKEFKVKKYNQSYQNYMIRSLVSIILKVLTEYSEIVNRASRQSAVNDYFMHN